MAVLISCVLVLVWRPLLFASVDPELAAARGVRISAVSIGFMVLLGLAVAMSVQVVGALLVLSLLVVPAAAALKISHRPLTVVLLSMTFGVTSAVAGIMIAITGTIPISPYITTISFLIYVVCLLIGRRQKAKRR